jgi:hypothetical protein
VAAPSLIAHVAVWSQLLPPAAVAAGRSWNVSARFWCGVGLLISAISDAAQFVLGRRAINNLWLGYLSTPLTGLMIMGALAAWQPTRRGVKVVRISMLIYAIMWATTVPIFEDVTRFSVVTLPVHSIVVLVLSLGTLIHNALQDRVYPLLRTDWFWACIGIAVLYGGASAIQPYLGVLIAGGRMQEAILVLNVKAGIQVFALMLITAGMLCPVQTSPSSLSFSPAH